MSAFTWSGGNLWNQNELLKLERLWRDGYSATLIAKQLPGRTRNAVIGKLHRLGMMKDDKRVVLRMQPKVYATKPGPKPGSRPALRRRKVQARAAPVSASDAELIAAALAAGKVTICDSMSAAGLSPIEQQFWTALPETSGGWRRAA